MKYLLTWFKDRQKLVDELRQKDALILLLIIMLFSISAIYECINGGLPVLGAASFIVAMFLVTR